MDELNETTRILNAEAIDQLTKMRNEEIGKILKLRLILRELKLMKAESLNLPDIDDVKHAQKVLSVADYLNLNEKDDDCLLNMRELRNTTLSYSDRKAVREYLLTQLPLSLQPIVDFGQKMRKELPNIFVDADSNANSSTTTTEFSMVNIINQTTNMTLLPISNSSQQKTLSSSAANAAAVAAFNSNSNEAQIIGLEKQRRANYEKYGKILQRKCQLLKIAAELKMGPYLNNELELLYAQARMNQIKTNVLRGFFINEYINSTEHTLKALKEVEGYVDQELEKLEKLDKTEKL